MTTSNDFYFTPIGIVRSPYQEKFAIPRQPGLTKVEAVIELLPAFAQPESVSGLEQFSHIWITFVFHAVAERGWKPLVRPPRLGGNERIGVFASRSTHRPNPIGLSVVELLRVEIGDGVRLHIRGGDFLDRTPVIDIKPYIPYADSIPHARGGFAQSAPQRLTVRWSDQALTSAQQLAPDLQGIVEQTLCFDPRPAYQDEPGRIYGVHLAGCNICFRIHGDCVEIVEVKELRE